MKKSIDFTRILAIITIISVITSICLVAANASSGTVYEVEENNAPYNATPTYDDCDNYGKLSSASDVDCWEITFSEEGIANFWLGNIPTDCNYDIFVSYRSPNASVYSQTQIITSSYKTSNKAELMRCHVYPNYIYYVFVHSFENSHDENNQYLLRIKNYPLDGGSINAKLFYADYSNYSTAEGITDAASQLWNSGFSAAYYRNNTVGPAYSVLPNSTIFVTANKGIYGQLYFHDSMVATSRTTLYAKPPSPMLNTDRAITSLPAKGLSNVYLAILMNPYSGMTHSTYGNLVDEMLKKEAFVCIGWNGSLSQYDQNNWFDVFLAKCTIHKTIEQAISDTNNHLFNVTGFSTSITDLYTGNSRIGAFSLN